MVRLIDGTSLSLLYIYIDITKEAWPLSLVLIRVAKLPRGGRVRNVLPKIMGLCEI